MTKRIYLTCALLILIFAGGLQAQEETKCWVCSKTGCDDTFSPDELNWWGGKLCSMRTWTDCGPDGCTSFTLCKTSGDCAMDQPPTGDPADGGVKRLTMANDYPVSPTVVDQIVAIQPALGPYIPLGKAEAFRGLLTTSKGLSYRYTAQLDVDGDSAVLKVHLKHHPEIKSLTVELWNEGRSGLLHIRGTGNEEELHTLGD